MSKLIEFGRMFLSYGVLLLLFVAVIALAVFIGTTLARRKKVRTAAEVTETAKEA